MAKTKLELADYLHKKMGLPKKDCLGFVNSFAGIPATVIPDFTSFKTKLPAAIVEPAPISIFPNIVLDA